MFRVAWKPASARPRLHLRRQCAALLLWLAPLPLLALTLRQENFESPSDGTNYTVVGEFGTNNANIAYFKRGANGNFAFSVNPLPGVHGTNFWGGERTTQNLATNEGQVRLGSVDVRGHNNLRITWAVAIGRDAPYVNLSPGAVGLYYSTDYMILQTALDGGAWTNVSIFRGTNDVAGYLSEDKDKNGIGDADGPTLTRTFTNFQYAIPGGTGTGVQARVLMYMGRSGAEAAFDDIRVTGDVLPPSITITNPAGAIVVSSATTNYNVQGTASAGVVWNILWTNGLTGLTGTIPASTNWAIPGVTLGAGVNLITVTGSNTVGALASNSVAITRILPPELTRTSPPGSTNVTDTTTNITVNGTANIFTVGLLRWTNALTGGAGTIAASTNWSIPGISLALGTNLITITGTNIVQESTNVTAGVYRVPVPALSITNPPAFSAVSDLVTNTTLSGTASLEAFGLLRWTNSLTGGAGSGAASTGWSLPGIPLALGTNAITVTASNIVNRTTTATVSVYRIPAPAVTITDPAGPVTVANGVTNRQVAGTANAVVRGLLSWSNALNGATGTTAAGTNWLAGAVPLAPGVNVITVRGTNDVGRLASAQAFIAREGTILLNEVLANPVGADAAGSLEFIELLNLAGGGNAGDLSIVELSGNGADKGVVAARWNLTGLTFGTNGLLAVGDNYDVTLGGAWSNQVSPHTRLADAGYVPDALLNTSITLLLVRNCQVSVTNGADLDANNDGVLDVAPWDAILDSVGWKDADVGDVVYRSAALTQTSNWPDGASRLQTNRVPQDPSAWFNGDVMTSGGDTLGRTYNGAAASLNLPAGAVLTPGRPNYPFPYDQDGDGLPDAWEQQYFSGATNGAPGADADDDGQSNQNEYWAGTNPTNPASLFEVTQIGVSGITSVEIYTNAPDVVTQTLLTVSANVLNWDSLTNRIYEVLGRGNMTNPFVRLQGGIAATPPLNVYTAAIGTNRTFYFRIGVLEPVYP